MKVLLLNGSPRKEGNCRLVTRRIGELLKEQGIEAEEIVLSEGQGIAPCRSCFQCFSSKNGKCQMGKDRFNEIQAKAAENDGLFVVTPVYTAAPTAPVKAFMERSSLVSMANGGQLDRKPAAAVAVARRAGTIPAVDSINRYFHVCSMFSVGSTYWNVLFGSEGGECLKDGEGMETLKNLVLNFSWLMKNIELGRGLLKEPETPRTCFTNFIE